jgi:hypothetical protein
VDDRLSALVGLPRWGVGFGRGQINCSGQANARKRDEAGGVLVLTCGAAGVGEVLEVDDHAPLRDGEVLRQAIRDLGWRRSDVVISTKLF